MHARDRRSDGFIHTVFYHAITRMPFAKLLHVMLGGAPNGMVCRFTVTFIGGRSALALAIGAALLATPFYGFAMNYSKRHLARVNPFVVACGSQVSASILLVPLALFFWQKHSVAPSTWACVAALGVICTGFAYVLSFRLIERVGAAYAASVTFTIPIFGMIWGAAFLGEAITPVMIAGCAIVLFGTALASGKLGWMLTRSARTSALENCEGPAWVCAVKRWRFPAGVSPARQLLQPEATGAAMEATKWLKPSVMRVTNW
ncbi:EamA-like transporter family protein [Burkholderia sp. OK233]|nr:EamA-like transporter family protein [Burkholderia sp. OK233]